MNDHLAHYGIKGQRWGIRRWQNSDGSYNEAGKLRYGVGSANQNSSVETISKALDNDAVFEKTVKTIDNKSHHAKDLAMYASTIAALSYYQYDAIKNFDNRSDAYASYIPVALASTALAGYAASREVKSIVDERKAKKRIANDKIDEETGLPLKAKKCSELEDAVETNPGRASPNRRYHVNCVLCSVNYELRRRGYDVIATRSKTGFEPEIWRSWFKDSKFDDMHGYKTVEEILNAQCTKENSKKMYNWTNENLLSQGEGARGLLNVVWVGGGGHAVNYIVKNNKVLIYDGQAGIKQDLKKMLDYSVDVGYTRLDNCDIDFDYLKKVGVIK